MCVVTKQVLLFSQMFGYLPLKFSGSKKEFQRLCFSPKVFVWSLMVISLQTVVAGLTLYEKYKKLSSELAAETKMDTSIISLFLDVVPLNTLAIIMFTSSTLKYPHFIKMCQLIERASKNLSSKKHDNNIKLKLPLVFIFTTLLLGLNTVSLTMHGRFLESITFRTIHIAEAAFLFHFSQAVQNAADLVHLFNHKLKCNIIRLSFGQLLTNHSLTNIEHIHTVTLPASPSNFNFNCLTRAYWILQQATTQANLFYGRQLFFSIFTSFLHSTLSFYFSFIAMRQGVELGEIPGIMLQLVWAVAHFSFVVLLVWPGNNLSFAANETAQIVCKLVNRDLNPELKEQMDSFLLQLLHCDVEITAMGFFPVQKHILISIVGAVTTYFVIMIQFQTGDS